MSELTEKIQKEMDVWEDLREYGIFEGVGIAKEIIEEHELQHEIKLNDNQKIVLEWLKEQVSIGNDLQYVLWEFTDNVYEEPAEYSVSEQTKAWLELTEQEQFQVLAAFAEWGMKEVAE